VKRKKVADSMVEISPQKKYIQVNVDYMPDGRMIPRRVTWEDGHSYEIDRVTDQRRAASLKAGGTGIRYTCRVGRQTCHLFYEDMVGRWFVELK
jgi:hypothetical protein